MNHKKHIWLVPMLAAAVVCQVPSVSAAQPPKTQPALLAQAAAAYTQAFGHLANGPYLQETLTQKSTITYGLTKLGKKTPSIAAQLRTAHDLEKDVAQLDDTSAKQPMIWYHSSDSMNGAVTYLQIGSKFYSNTGKGWAANNADLGSVASMLTLRAIPPFNSFEHPVVKKTSHGYTISGAVSIKKYFSQVKSQMTAMNLVLPGLSTAGQNSFMNHMYEYDSVTVDKVGRTYFITNDVSSDKLTIPSSVMAEMLGASPSTISKYLSSMTEQTSSTVTYVYKSTHVQVPAGVKKLQGGNGSSTVGGSVYGTSN